MTEKRVVLIRGGHFDGQRVEVHPAQLRIVLPYDRGTRVYEVGEWGREGSAPVVSRLVDFAVYDRVDAETFEVAA